MKTSNLALLASLSVGFVAANALAMDRNYAADEAGVVKPLATEAIAVYGSDEQGVLPSLAGAETEHTFGSDESGVEVLGEVANPTKNLAETEAAEYTCPDIDINNDGIFPDWQDVSDYLALLSGDETLARTGDAVDFNKDGIFPDMQDFYDLLDAFSGGGCE